jgi:hypothetical protein
VFNINDQYFQIKSAGYKQSIKGFRMNKMDIQCPFEYLGLCPNALSALPFGLHTNCGLPKDLKGATTLLILGSNFNSTVRVEITPFWGVKKIEYISLQNQG